MQRTREYKGFNISIRHNNAGEYWGLARRIRPSARSPIYSERFAGKGSKEKAAARIRELIDERLNGGA